MSTLASDTVLVNCAPAVLQRLLGGSAVDPVGSQIKINIVVRRLPRFRSGIDPEIGFAGTLHLGQSYRELQAAYEIASAGDIPDPLPCEVYCHTLTDQSILSPELQAAGFHTLTLFGLHTPGRAVHALTRTAPASGPDGPPSGRCRTCWPSRWRTAWPPTATGRPCIEVMTPLDIEAAVGMPGGHIFHGDLSWPWLADDAQPRPPPSGGAWRRRTPGLLLCGSGAVRGGAVSGLGGHNAAMAVLAG